MRQSLPGTRQLSDIFGDTGFMFRVQGSQGRFLVRSTFGL